jgi:hypothetical protein
MTRQCLCFSCKLHRRAQRVMKNGSHRQKNDLIKELGNYWCEESEDNSYHKCILDGSWPGSVEILERSLIEAKKIAEEREQ